MHFQHVNQQWNILIFGIPFHQYWKPPDPRTNHSCLSPEGELHSVCANKGGVSRSTRIADLKQREMYRPSATRSHWCPPTFTCCNTVSLPSSMDTMRSSGWIFRRHVNEAEWTIPHELIKKSFFFLNWSLVRTRSVEPWTSYLWDRFLFLWTRFWNKIYHFIKTFHNVVQKLDE